MLIQDLNDELDKKHLLKHSFYQAWLAGELTQDDLKYYAKQYYHHVDAFPRYISAAHSNCELIKARQVLLENLNDEESGDEHHPELWLQFCEGLGLSRDEVINAALLPETKNLINDFLSLAKSSYAEGLGALYAYERQVPDTAASKIKGLAEFYNINDERTLMFFKVHVEADVEHSAATCELYNNLSEAEKTKAAEAAEKIADSVWNLLSGIQSQTLDARGRARNNFGI